MDTSEFKLLFSGPMGAGKTTAINAISDTPCVSTDTLNTNRDQFDKAFTTTALDYGQIALDDNNVAHLYGTPGQERFQFMWPILARDAAGVVVLLNGDDDRMLAQLDLYLEAFWQNGSLPLVIGVGRLPEAQTDFLLTHLMQHLEKKQMAAPVFPVDVRRKDDVLMLIDTLLCLVEANELMAMPN